MAGYLAQISCKKIQSISMDTFIKESFSEDQIFNHVISDISLVLRETTLTTSDSIETGSPIETEIVRVVSLSTTEITEITRFKTKRSSVPGYLQYSMASKSQVQVFRCIKIWIIPFRSMENILKMKNLLLRFLPKHLSLAEN